MDRDRVVARMKDLYKRAAKAREEGKRAQARSFRAGGRRLQRQLRGMPKPAPATTDEAAG